MAKEVEKSLGPEEYHFRMPFFGKPTDDGGVRINGAIQSIMDEEITYASRAGIDYWAFCSYGKENPLSNGLELYLSSGLRKNIDFCLFSNINSNIKFFQDDNIFKSEIIQEPGYMTVQNDRPLLYLFSPSDEQIKRDGGIVRLKEWLDFITMQCESRGRGKPYYVLSEGNTSRGKELCNGLGIDALGLYATTAGPYGGAPYETLTAVTEATWDRLAATGLPIVPNIMTGWDKRPRLKHPVDWEKTSRDPQPENHFYQDGTPGEIAQHVNHALTWIKDHPRSAPADTALIYAWNECDEGFGALIPTYDPNDPNGDSRRLDAVATVLSTRH